MSNPNTSNKTAGFHLQRFENPAVTPVRFMRFVRSGIFILLFCLLDFPSHGQLLTNYNIAVTISGGAQLTVKGDVQNNPGTTIGNSGILDLTGNWINLSGGNVFGASAGTVILNGANQQIGGTSVTLFHHLLLQGSGVKVLMNHASVGGLSGNGILNIGNRSLDLNSKILTITNPAPAGISYTTGMIISEKTDHSSVLQWNMGSATGNHVIPFGTYSGIQVPLGINPASGTIGNVTASTYPTAATNTPLPTVPVTVTHVRNVAGMDNSGNTVDRFWQIDKTGVSGTAALTFSFTPAEAPANGSVNLRAQRWNPVNEGWEQPLPGQSNPGVISVLVPLVSSFGAWAISLESSPLPVDLVSFDATVLANQQVLLNWVSESQINNDFFTVERSRDGITFEELVRVKGHGTTTERHRYAVTDRIPWPGVSYYRLRQTDFNGHYTLTGPEQVQLLRPEPGGMAVYPNPVRDVVYVVTAGESSITLTLYDMTGKEVFRSETTGELRQLDLSLLPAGPYFLMAGDPETSQVSAFKVMKVR